MNTTGVCCLRECLPRPRSPGVNALAPDLVITTFLLNSGEEMIGGTQIQKVLKDPKSVGTSPPPRATAS
jgi:hypothetical protein